MTRYERPKKSKPMWLAILWAVAVAGCGVPDENDDATLGVESEAVTTVCVGRVSSAIGCPAGYTRVANTCTAGAATAIPLCIAGADYIGNWQCRTRVHCGDGECEPGENATCCPRDCGGTRGGGGK